MQAAEGNVRAPFGQSNASDLLARRVEDVDAVKVWVTHAPAAPEIAIHINAHAVRRAVVVCRDQGAAIGNAGAIINQVVRENGAWRRAGVNDVKFRFVRRKSEAIGAVDVAGNDGYFAGLRVPAINVGGQFRRGGFTFVITENAVGRI